MLNRRGNSIIEIMVVIVILSVGIVGAYNIVYTGQKLSTTAGNRMKAINIAREGLEGVENIRDTNWIKFSSDYTNCWNVDNYNATCIGNSSASIASGSYVLVPDNSLWKLVSKPVVTSSYTENLTHFPVYLDNNGLVVSSGSSLVTCTLSIQSNCKSIFTREIRISYPDSDHLKVNSIVTWMDTSKADPHVINFETILTNWKKKF